MGLADAFGRDDRIEVKTHTLLEIIKTAAQADEERRVMVNAVNCEVPYRYIREMLTGVPEAPEDNTPDQDPVQEEHTEDVILSTWEEQCNGGKGLTHDQSSNEND